MKLLHYQALKEQEYDGYLLKEAPERVLQFGEGNFLRAFADCFIDQMNERAGFDGKVVLVQPNARESSCGTADRMNEQEGLYTLYLRGLADGQRVNEKRIISCVSRCLNMYRDYDSVMACAENPDLRFILCNTTEAGIVYDPSCGRYDTPPASYPAKLTQFLYRRFLLFGDTAGKGFVILPCELIEDNGQTLKQCVLRYSRQWKMGAPFLQWLEKETIFCSTLVDRIVTGYPTAEAETLERENGYRDCLMDTGELFASWIIEGPETLKQELPAAQAGLPVRFTYDHRPYRERKVRILNGAHTLMAPGAFLAGQKIVRECMQEPVIRAFLDRAVYDEILPTLSLPEEECRDFAAAVIERFQNPFIDHSLLAISLNSTSKWRTRLLPSLEGFLKTFGYLPECITASFAFYLAFCHGTKLTDKGLLSRRENGDVYTVSDDRQVLNFYYTHRRDSTEELVRAVCGNLSFWGRDLTELPGFEETVCRYLDRIRAHGVLAVMRQISDGDASLLKR